MPRLAVDDNMTTHRIGGTTFHFSGTKIGTLGASEYTLVQVYWPSLREEGGHPPTPETQARIQHLRDCLPKDAPTSTEQGAGGGR